jgi:Tol biopolymer transport system component
MHPDGSDQRNVTQDPAAEDLNPSWAPNGQRLALTSDRDGTQDIWAVSLRGGGARNLTPDPADDRNASWSPDGRLIAFASNRDGDFEIFCMRANGEDPTRLTHNTSTDVIPDWQRLFPRRALASKIGCLESLRS